MNDFLIKITPLCITSFSVICNLSGFLPFDLYKLLLIKVLISSPQLCDFIPHGSKRTRTLSVLGFLIIFRFKVSSLVTALFP